MRVLAIDTETTGLDPATDEVIQVGIVDATDGRPVLATHVRPSRTASWPDAEAVNHISPDMVADAPSQDEVARRVRNAVRGSDAVVAYNAPFDAAFLAHMGALPDDVWVEDLMMPVAVANGAWDERHGHARWLRLDEAAALAAYAWGDDRGHDAVADARPAPACGGGSTTATHTMWSVWESPAETVSPQPWRSATAWMRGTAPVSRRPAAPSRAPPSGQSGAACA